jgi:hypothetical protein
MTQHDVGLVLITGEYIDRRGKRRLVVAGAAVSCTCGLLTGSVPAGYARRVYDNHRARFGDNNKKE